MKNLTVDYTSCAKEGLIKISNLLHGVPDGQRAASKPHAPSPKFGTAVQSYRLLLPSWLFMTVYAYTKTTLQKVMTRPAVTVICFEI